MERFIGVRVNPQVGASGPAATSTATATSKFGVTLDPHRGQLLDAFRRHPWLSGLHVHIGSQALDVGQLVEGVGLVADFAADLQGRLGDGRPSVIDIGGGLPVAYRAGSTAPGFADYADALARRAPLLMTTKVRLVTEFGRKLVCRAAWVGARVEYTKEAGGGPIAITHAGANLFLREAYIPGDCWHEITIHAPDGRTKEGDEVEQDIAGPLCFGGDYLAKRRRLPRIEPGDWVVVHDAGAYTLSMYSRYNSRPAPAVYGFDRALNDRESTRFELWKPAETTADVLRFWGA